MAEQLSSEEAPSRYVVGIDLGTTNSAVAFVDTSRGAWRVDDFAVPQLVAPGQVEPRDTLPSFHYEPAAEEFAASPQSLRLPWSRETPGHVVGVFARDHGAEVPQRLISSAKSWLCHSGVDRTQELLPWHGAPDVTRLSPVEASARYLGHVRAAWDQRFPSHPLAEQDVVITLPASFDEVARELTVEAAARAGLARVVLIEEPQAAFYHWIDKHRDDWEQRVQPRQRILVCDIGGGTSDFTLILVRRDEGADRVKFHRVAVGDHLLLGGDNLDLALAQHVEARLSPGQRLPPRQWDALWRQCRPAKEQLLGERPPEALTINVAAGGSRLIGGSLQCEVGRAEAERLLLDGFFPLVPLDAEPRRQQSGFQEFGLPFAVEPAVTTHLAAFLRAHRDAPRRAGLEDDGGADELAVRPDIVLFNGGVFDSPRIRDRLLEAIGRWFATPDGRPWSPEVLENDRLDLAVARGAAYFGMVRRGEGVKIASGLARTYYIGVETETGEPRALCLVPASAEPGTDIELERQFRLQVATPVEFPLHVSSTRLTDSPGELIEVDREQLKSLPPIRTVLQTRGRVGAALSVRLHARITEIGTLELWCRELDGDRQWRLQFDVRSATQTDIAEHTGGAERSGFYDESQWEACRAVIEGTYGEQGKESPSGLMKRLGEVLGANRSSWPPSLLRRIWESLVELAPARRRGPQHEARWLNLLGFSLRPGYGMAVDDWRVSETWRLVQGKLVHGAPECRVEGWILWRRIAGGLRAGQQQTLSDPLLGLVRQLHRRMVGSQGAAKGPAIDLTSHEAAELWRLLGSLEHLPLPTKIELGDLIVDLLPRRKLQPIRSGLLWALGRVGARAPVYGLLNDVVPVERVERWLRTLLDAAEPTGTDHLALMQLARRTHDRYRDIGDAVRADVLRRLEQGAAPPSLRTLVAEGGSLDEEQQAEVFGESLPCGLRIG